MKKFLISLCLLYNPSLFAQQSAAPSLPNTLSLSDKIYGLSEFWEQVNYNFVYIDRIDRTKWDSTYRALITQVANTPNDYTYYRLLQKFCATLHDGHTNVWLPANLGNLQLTKMFGDYWFGTENIDGRAIVTRTLRSKLKEIPIGSEVIEVNGMTTAQYLTDSVKPYISSSTDYVLEDWAISGLLQGLVGATYKVKIRRPDGSVLPLTLTHETTKDTAFYPPFPNDRLLELKWYVHDIAYLALNSFDDRKIDSMFIEKLPELYKAKGLIIDLRKNGGGSTNIGTEILQYLMADSVMSGSRSFTRQHLAAFKAWGKYVKPADTLFNPWNKKAWYYNHDKMMYAFDYSPDTIHLSARRLVVPTAILVGHGTASAAEDFLIAADNQHHMTRIGDRSFGSTGQPFLFDLPGGGGARVCTKKDTWLDGREFVGFGVAPQIEVAPTVKDFVDNKDPVLDKSLAYLQQQIGKK
jgi:C-terminal processing protease CtpA/Prc